MQETEGQEEVNLFRGYSILYLFLYIPSSHLLGQGKASLAEAQNQEYKAFLAVIQDSFTLYHRFIIQKNHTGTGFHLSHKI